MVNRVRQIKLPSLSVVINIITIIAFLITLITFIYNSGKKEQRIVQLEEKIVIYENKIEKLKTEVNEQGKIAVDINAKLDLLLEYFDITRDK